MKSFSILLVCLLLLCGFNSLYAESHPVEVRFHVGMSSFLDSPPINHTVFGGSVRFYLSKRLGLEPEFIYWDPSTNGIPGLRRRKQKRDHSHINLALLEMY
jgi:hypothetical protein